MNLSDLGRFLFIFSAIGLLDFAFFLFIFLWQKTEDYPYLDLYLPTTQDPKYRINALTIILLFNILGLGTLLFIKYGI